MVPRLLIVSIVISGTVLVFVYNKEVYEGVEKFCDWMESNKVAGVFSMLGFCTVATVMFVPGVVMTVGSGFIMHNVFDEKWQAILLGTLTVLLGAWIGATLTFLLGRYVLQDVTKRLT